MTGISSPTAGEECYDMAMKHMTRVLTLYVLVFLVICGVSAACNAGKRQDTLRAAFTATNVVRDGFVAWDAQHQRELVEAATSLEQGRTSLAEYRKKRDDLVMIFEIVYRTLVDAALKDDDASAATAVRRAQDLAAAIKAFTGP